ncbi:MAG: hypothetical protein ACU85E_16885 [Gammaproteobacteria bacterium]
MKLDLDKDYGTVYGIDVAYTYVQDGKFFNAALQEVDEQGNLIDDDTRRTHRRSSNKT